MSKDAQLMLSLKSIDKAKQIWQIVFHSPLKYNKFKATRFPFPHNLVMMTACASGEVSVSRPGSS